MADRLGQPILHLDDFYRDDEDPKLPRHGAHADWESPAAWHGGRAVAAGLLAAAVVLRKNPLLTFIRRMRRDFADGRKPPQDIVRIGVGKLVHERSVVRSLVAAGGTPMSNHHATRYLWQVINK